MSLDKVFHIDDYYRQGGILTNGCFDIIHRGHIKLFEFCHNYSIRLNCIVAVNSDKSIRDLKGLNRPVMKEADRVALLSAIHYIDAVVLFDTKSVLPVIKKINPQVLVKGGNYSTKPCAIQDQIVGQEFVESYGGEVVTGPMVEGVSTTAILERIRNENADSR